MESGRVCAKPDATTKNELPQWWNQRGRWAHTPSPSRLAEPHSTVTQLALLVNKWQLALDKGLCIESAFLDLSKAYDRVSIAGLMFKLSNYGCCSVSPQAYWVPGRGQYG